MLPPASSTPGDGLPPTPSGSWGIRNVRLIAWLMIAQGIFEGLFGFLYAVSAVLWYFVVSQPGRPESPDESFMPLLELVSMASVLIPAVLHIWAGIQNLSFSSYTFGIVALLSGVLSVYSLWWAPTGVVLLIVGLIVYLQADTREAFEQVAAGKSADALLKMQR